MRGSGQQLRSLVPLRVPRLRLVPRHIHILMYKPWRPEPPVYPRQADPSTRPESVCDIPSSVDQQRIQKSSSSSMFTCHQRLHLSRPKEYLRIFLSVLKYFLSFISFSFLGGGFLSRGRFFFLDAWFSLLEYGFTPSSHGFLFPTSPCFFQPFYGPF